MKQGYVFPHRGTTSYKGACRILNPFPMSDPTPSSVRGKSSTPARRRKFIGVSIALLLVVAGFYGGWWWFAASQFDDAIETWSEQRRAEGWKVGYQNVHLSGFPVDLRATIVAPEMSRQGWAWRVENLTLSAKPWSVNHARFAMTGLHKGTLVMEGRNRPFVLDAGGLSGGMIFSQGQVQSLNITGRGLDLEFDKGAEIFTLGNMEASARLMSAEITEFDLRLRDLKVPDRMKAPLGPRLRHLRLKGELAGRLSGRTMASVVSNWRQQGGRVGIRALDLGYGPLQMGGDGTISLDGNLQPTGSLATRSRGVMEMIDALVDAGLIKGMDSLGAKVVLAALSKTPEGGGERVLELSITLKDRILAAGPFKLLKVRPVRW
jgi:hypothetical protein